MDDASHDRLRRLVGPSDAEREAQVGRSAKGHRLRWESTVLAPVPERPSSLAEDIAADLDVASGAMREIVHLHLEALDASLAFDSPALLGDQRTWQQTRLDALHSPFGVKHLEQGIRDALNDYLDESGRELVLQTYAEADRWRREHPPMVSDPPMAPAPTEFLQAAMEGRRQDACRMVLQMLRDDVTPAEVMLDVLAPAQVRLGRLWERGDVTVAQEHATTAITQMALSLLYPRVQVAHSEWAENPLSAKAGTVVATGVGYEAHEIGIRMVSDLMELSGWAATYLGVDVPMRDVIAIVGTHRADVLAISATMAGHVAAVRRLIAYLRESPGGDTVKVLVGGRPFELVPELADAVGADGWAADPREALRIAESWLA